MDPWLDILIIIAIIPFVMLQLCMVVFLSHARRNDEMLRNGFFTIFMAISVADCIYMTVVWLPMLVTGPGLAGPSQGCKLSKNSRRFLIQWPKKRRQIQIRSQKPRIPQLKRRLWCPVSALVPDSHSVAISYLGTLHYNIVGNWYEKRLLESMGSFTATPEI